MLVDRCICHNVTFAMLKERDAAAAPATDLRTRLSSLSNATGCCTNCGMCKPYVIEMLLSGKTGFPLFSQSLAGQIVAQFEAGLLDPKQSQSGQNEKHTQQPHRPTRYDSLYYT